MVEGNYSSFVHRMQVNLEPILSCLGTESANADKLEADLANVCFTLQTYEVVFANCRELVGGDKNTNLEELISLLFDTLETLRETNMGLERELREAEKLAVPPEPQVTPLSKVEIGEVWKLYDLVVDKLKDIEILKRDLRDVKKKRLEQGMNFLEEIQCVDSDEDLALELISETYLDSRPRIPLGVVTNFASNEQNLDQANSKGLGKLKKRRRRRRRPRKPIKSGAGESGEEDEENW